MHLQCIIIRGLITTSSRTVLTVLVATTQLHCDSTVRMYYGEVEGYLP